MIKKVSSKLSPICFMPDGTLVCYRFGNVVLMKEGKEIKHHTLFKNKRERLLGRCNLMCRLMRLGIRTSFAIDNETIVLSAGNMLYEFNILSGERSEGYFCGDGIRPLIFSQVRNVLGFDDGIYFGGYIGVGLLKKRPIHIYHRVNVDKWEVVFSFQGGAINHVHNIVADPYRNCLWIFTGDFGEAAAIWKVTDNFRKVERVACNNQRYRACVAFAVPEGVIYATDAPFADDYIYLLNPDTMECKEIFPIHGSCIYGCQWKDKYVFSSTVEGDGRNMSRMEFYFGRKRGAGIKDDYVHLYCGNMQEGFKEIYKDKKDCMPYYTFQFGSFRFPNGKNSTDTLYFQPVATKKNDLCLMALNEKDASN